MEFSTLVAIHKDVARVVIAGDVDLATSEEFDLMLRNAVKYARGRVEVDFSDLRYIDSIGLAILTSAREAAGEKGLEFAIEGVTPDVRHVVETLGLAELLPVA